MREHPIIDFLMDVASFAVTMAVIAVVVATILRYVEAM